MLTILFDFDGTLADTPAIQLPIIKDILVNKYNYKLSDADFDNLLKILRDKGPFAALLKIKFPLFKYPSLLKDIKGSLKSKMDNLKISKEMRDVIFTCKKYAKIGILSGGNKDYIQIFIQNNKLENIFEYIYTDDKTQGKEKLFKKFLNTTKISKEDVVYVGDEIQDIKISKKIGIKIISVIWGVNSKKGLVENNPDFIADTPNQIVQFIKN